MDTAPQPTALAGTEPARTRVNEPVPLYALDAVDTPREVILPALASQLATLASRIESIKDLSVELNLSRDGTGTIRFRAYSRF